MYNLCYNFSQYIPVDVKLNILNVSTLNVENLQYAIDEFQTELNWKEMWDVDDAIHRINDKWDFNVIENNDKIFGWVWYNPVIKELCNLYVHEDHRGNGIGSGLVYSMMNLTFRKNINEIYCKVDDWNVAGYSLFTRCGWVAR